MSYEEAAAVPFGASTALNFLKKWEIFKRGQKVLINGASWGVGNFTVQLGAFFGAEVTDVCSTKNLELVKSLGADHVIDYTKEDFTKNNKVYNINFDAVGKNTFSNYKNSLMPNGIYLSTEASLPLIFQMLQTSFFGNKKAKFALPKLTMDDMILLKGVIELKKLKVVIDKGYSLNQIAEAHIYSEKGNAIGKISIIIN